MPGLPSQDGPDPLGGRADALRVAGNAGAPARPREARAKESLEAGAKDSGAARRLLGLIVALHPRRFRKRAARGGSRQGSWRWVEACRVCLVPAPPAAPATATATATKPTAAAWGLLASLVDGQRPAAEIPAVQRVDGRIGVRLAPHLDEGEPARDDPCRGR